MKDIKKQVACFFWPVNSDEDEYLQLWAYRRLYWKVHINWEPDFGQYSYQWLLLCNWQGNSEHSNHRSGDRTLLLHSQFLKCNCAGNSCWGLGNYFIQYIQILQVHSWSQDAPENQYNGSEG